MYEINDSHYPITPYPIPPYTAYTSANILISIGITSIIMSFYLSIARVELQYIVIGTFYGSAFCFTGCALQLYWYMSSYKYQAVADIEE